MKSRLRTYSLVISFLFALLVGYAHHAGLFQNFEDKSLDWRFRIRGAQVPKAPILIVKIDDASLEALGKWPWPRKVHAQFIDVCRRMGASAVVYDVLFLEPDRYDPENDRALARASKRFGKVIASFNFNFITDKVAETDEEGTTRFRQNFVVREDPVEEILKGSAAAGFVNAWQDPDAHLRFTAAEFEFEEKPYYPLGIWTVSLLKNEPPEQILGKIPWYPAWHWDAPSKDVLVNWRGPEEDSFETRSFADVLSTSDEWASQWIKDKIILVGSTAIGLHDHYPVPFSRAYPGVYLHANVIDNLWGNDFLRPLPSKLTLILVFLFSIGVGLSVPRFPAWWGAATTLSTAFLLWGVGYLLMVKKLLCMELVAPTVALLGSYIAVFFYRFIIEQREKAGIKKAFGVYVNPHVVDQIAKNPEALKLGGELREMTVMFSDIASFTTISERLSPVELVHLLNIYLTSMTETIMKYDGTVDKYEGDAIMAFWGAPLKQPNHAKRACLAILENRERLSALNAELKAKGMHELFARCALNTGPMNVGNMGSSQKFNYTVMGDSVNLASRLEGANKQYRTALMISESTYEAAKELVEVRELDLLKVKGKTIPIKVYELVCKKGELSDSQKKGFEIYREGLELYRKRSFKKAAEKFMRVGDILNEDGPSETYLSRCKDYLESPPSREWDGAFVMTSK